MPIQLTYRRFSRNLPTPSHLSKSTPLATPNASFSRVSQLFRTLDKVSAQRARKKGSYKRKSLVENTKRKFFTIYYTAMLWYGWRVWRKDKKIVATGGEVKGELQRFSKKIIVRDARVNMKSKNIEKMEHVL